jgi:hypothetical protein
MSWLQRMEERDIVYGGNGYNAYSRAFQQGCVRAKRTPRTSLSRCRDVSLAADVAGARKCFLILTHCVIKSNRGNQNSGAALSLNMACRNNAGAGTGAFRAAILAALLLAVPGAAPAHAQGTALHSSSYITPFPQTDRYQLRVIGDWLASGLAAGLQDALKNENPVQITDLSRPGFGLVRQNDLNNEIGRMLAGPPVHIVVIMLGANDRIAMRTEAGRAQPGSEEWKELYGKEAEKLTKKLRAANVAVYWVGLPVMGNAATNEYAGMLNDTVRQAAYIAGAKFIETSAGFTDQSGAYSAWGPDVTGQTKRLREGDGQSLTAAGSRKLASYIEAALRRDLAQARSERNIPLAGDEEEQARVVPHPGATKAAANAPAGPGLPAATPKTEPAGKPGVSPSPAQTAVQRDQAAFASSSPQGEFVLADLSDGLTSIAVITPASDLSIREIVRQTPLAERLYFKVLSKGEALPAKEGRADDFRWRPEEAGPPQ